MKHHVENCEPINDSNQRTVTAINEQLLGYQVVLQAHNQKRSKVRARSHLSKAVNMKLASSNNSSKSSSSPIPVMLVVAAMLSLSATAFQPAAVRTTSTKQRSDTTVLQYRYNTADTMEDQPILMQLANGNLAATEGTIVSSSGSSFLQMMAAQDHDLSAMDEYLEYVDKRYARMHPHEVTLTSSSSPAAVVATAVHMSTSTTAATTTNDEEKAPLYKLGLSRLASSHLRNRLLQKHARTSITMTLLVRYVSRFLKPLSVLFGTILVVTAFARGNGYSA